MRRFKKIMKWLGLTLALVLVIGVVTVWLTWWVIWTVYELLASRSARWLRHAIRWLRRHPVFRRIAGPLLDSDQPEVLSITMMGLLLVLVFWGMAILMFLSPFSAHPQSIDQAVQSYALSLRNHIADPLMVALTQLSRLGVLIPTSMAASAASAVRSSIAATAATASPWKRTSSTTNSG